MEIPKKIEQNNLSEMEIYKIDPWSAPTGLFILLLMMMG
jgi:hypothetical protein